MIAHLRAMPELFRIGFAGAVAYRAEMVIWILSATMPLIMLALWNAVAAGGVVAGLDQTAMARYFAANLVVRQLTSSWVVWELNWEIRTGRLSPKLLRPVNPLWNSALQNLAVLPFRILILLPMLAALLWWRPELARLPELWEVPAFLVSVAMAWTLAFATQCAFAMLAFWIDQSMGVWGLYFGIWMVFSGYIAPLRMFPASIRDVLGYLPFRAMLSVPTELLAGMMTPAQAVPALGLQLGWVAVMIGVSGLLWTRGVRRYGAFGA
jgi:ABC-2 type transport system permease protein